MPDTLDEGLQPQADSGEPESVVWTGTPSQWTNFWCFVLCILIIPIPFAIYRYLKVATTNHELTTERYRITQGILGRTTEEVELYRIRDTALTQTLIERILGLGTIEISSSDERTPVVHLRSIKEPIVVREHLRTLTEKMRKRRGVRDIDFS